MCHLFHWDISSERRGLGAIDWVQKHLAPPAGRGIDKVRNIPGGDPQSERIPGDRFPLDETRGSERRGDGGEFIDDDLGRGLTAKHGKQDNRRIVAAALVDRGFAAFGNQIQDGVAARGLFGLKLKPPIGARFCLGQLLGFTGTRGPKGHCGFFEGSAAYIYASLDPFSRSNRAAHIAEQSTCQHIMAIFALSILSISLPVCVNRGHLTWGIYCFDRQRLAFFNDLAVDWFRYRLVMHRFSLGEAIPRPSRAHALGPNPEIGRNFLLQNRECSIWKKEEFLLLAHWRHAGGLIEYPLSTPLQSLA